VVRPAGSEVLPKADPNQQKDFAARLSPPAKNRSTPTARLKSRENRTRQKSVEFFDAARQRCRSIDPLIRALPNWLDMQIRNLRDQRPRRRHL